MAELKPVPSGYDSQALSSMLGYLANARKSHDNNPFMRTILDQQARDNKAEYLADADLTRAQQMTDNDEVQALNLRKMLQEAHDTRLGRSVTMNTTSGGSLVSDDLAADQELSQQSDEGQDAVLNALGLDKLLDPIKKKADIGKAVADTGLAEMNTLQSGQQIAESQASMGQLTSNNIANPNREVTPNLDNMASIINAREQASGVRDAAKIGQNNKTTQPGIIGKDGKWQAVSPEQAEMLSKKGVKVTYGAVTDSIETRGTPAPRVEGAKLPTPITDIAQAESRLKAEGYKVDGMRIGSGGTVEALVDGKWQSVSEE